MPIGPLRARGVGSLVQPHDLDPLGVRAASRLVRHSEPLGDDIESPTRLKALRVAPMTAPQLDPDSETPEARS